ncbi:hypothetical protein B0H19DRAFT_1160767, partial [Mycena capillaripes]
HPPAWANRSVQVPGFLKVYVGSFSHKNPGRVVTLVHEADWDLFSTRFDPLPDEGIVCGVHDILYIWLLVLIFHICLDYREKDDYTMESMPIYAVVDGVETIIVPHAYVCIASFNSAPQ